MKPCLHKGGLTNVHTLKIGSRKIGFIKLTTNRSTLPKRSPREFRQSEISSNNRRPI